MADLTYAEKIAQAAALKGPVKKPNYYELLGRFVTMYARAEIQAHVLARHFSGAQDAQARILFHKLGLTKIIELVRELMGSHTEPRGILNYFAWPPESYSDVDICLSQLAAIATKRGELVHRDTVITDEGFRVTNIMTAKQLANYEQTIITKAQLEAMTFDCSMIFLFLAQAENPQPDFLFGRPRPETWQYKPPQPVPRKEPRMKARKERKLRRAASRAKQSAK